MDRVGRLVLHSKRKRILCGDFNTPQDELLKYGVCTFAQKINKKGVVCKVQSEQDRYKRYIGVCFSGGINLNQWMVRNGHAVAYRKYSKDYIKDENYAKKNKLGLWSGDFINPEKWRKLN